MTERQPLVSNTLGDATVQGQASLQVGNNYYFSPDDRRKRETSMLRSLRTSPYRDRKDRNRERVAGTCEWFLAHRLFNQWRDHGSSSMLWVSADPGCGKSVLAKHLIDNVLPTTADRTTCYFFFKDDFDDQRSANGALRCILHQLLFQKKHLLSDDILRHFEANGDFLLNSIAELWDLLVTLSRDPNAGEVVCILDAYDECAERERIELTKALCDFYGSQNTATRLKLLLTSRPYGRIGQGFEPINLPGLPVIHLKGENEEEVQKIAQEINLVIEAETRTIGKSMILQPDEEKLLLQQLLRVPHRTYLWAHLTLDLIRKDIYTDKSRILAATSQLPQTVDEAYDRLLSKSINHEEARKLLHIVVAATRPLTLGEMAVALAIREHRSYEDLDLKQGDLFRKYVRDLCGLFVTIIDSKIYLLHQTAREFLVQGTTGAPATPGATATLAWKHCLRPSDSHLVLARICIQHLLFDEFQIGDHYRPFDYRALLRSNRQGLAEELLMDHPLLDYSARNWFIHARDSGTERVDESVLKLCGWKTNTVPAWFDPILSASSNLDAPEKATPLMIASYCGVLPAASFLLKNDHVQPGYPVDGTGRSPLSVASERGFKDIVELFLNDPSARLRRASKRLLWLGTDIETRCREGRTPLAYAALHGHADVVRSLLKAGSRIDAKDNIGATPVSHAICSGNQETAALVLQGQQNQSLETKINQQLASVLVSAARTGSVRILELILETGRVSVDVEAGDGSVALCSAAQYGPKATVQLLLDNGAGPDRQDKKGNTALHGAALRGSEVLVSLLLEKGASVKLRNKNGETALHYATSPTFGSYEPVVRLLLQQGAEPNCENKNGQTPLHIAAGAFCGSEGVIRVLLAGGADPNHQDRTGVTPLHVAVSPTMLHGPEAIQAAKDRAQQGAKSSLSVVELLLLRGANPNSQDKNRETPLHIAAASGKRDLVLALLDKRADPTLKDGKGRTPIDIADDLWQDYGFDYAVVGFFLRQRERRL